MRLEVRRLRPNPGHGPEPLASLQLDVDVNADVDIVEQVAAAQLGAAQEHQEHQ
jgi:hypothetical protein